MKNYRFYKEDLKWYVDLPEWEGDKSSLQMVAGADDMLELYAENKDEVTLIISEELFEDSDKLIMLSIADDIGEGAYYKMEKFGAK